MNAKIANSSNKARTRKSDMPKDEELHLLQRDFDKHIIRFDAFVIQQNEMWEKMIQSQKETTLNINKLVTCTNKLQESTCDIVDAWNTGKGVVKAGSAIGKFFKWLGGFAAVGVIIAWFGDHIKF